MYAEMTNPASKTTASSPMTQWNNEMDRGVRSVRLQAEDLIEEAETEMEDAEKAVDTSVGRRDHTIDYYLEQADFKYKANVQFLPMKYANFVKRSAEQWNKWKDMQHRQTSTAASAEVDADTILIKFMHMFADYYMELEEGVAKWAEGFKAVEDKEGVEASDEFNSRITAEKKRQQEYYGKMRKFKKNSTKTLEKLQNNWTRQESKQLNVVDRELSELEDKAGREATIAMQIYNDGTRLDAGDDDPITKTDALLRAETLKVDDLFGYGKDRRKMEHAKSKTVVTKAERVLRAIVSEAQAVMDTEAKAIPGQYSMDVARLVEKDGGGSEALKTLLAQRFKELKTRRDASLEKVDDEKAISLGQLQEVEGILAKAKTGVMQAASDTYHWSSEWGGKINGDMEELDQKGLDFYNHMKDVKDHFNFTAAELTDDMENEMHLKVQQMLLAALMRAELLNDTALPQMNSTVTPQMRDLDAKIDKAEDQLFNLSRIETPGLIFTANNRTSAALVKADLTDRMIGPFYQELVDNVSAEAHDVWKLYLRQTNSTLADIKDQ